MVVRPAGLEGHAAEDVGVPEGRFARLTFEVLCEAVEGYGLSDEIRADVHPAVNDVAAVDEYGQRRDDQAVQGIQDKRMKD